MAAKLPKREDIEAILKRLDEDPDLYSKLIPKDASLVDQMKRDICAELIIYRRTQGMNQRELAQKLEIGEALVSRLLHYRFEQFTLDRMIRYLEILGIRFEFKRVA